jgi:TPR repeat protein
MRIRIVVTTLLSLAALPSFGLDTKEAIDRAIEQVDAHRYGLARVYLDPIVIDERESADKRARAYYVRGYSFFSEGLYVSAAQDYESALDLAPDYPIALVELGHLYADGLGVKKSPARAFRLLQRAARGGNEAAKFYVGYAWLTGAGTPANITKARYWLREAVAAGRVEALTQLARSYRTPYAEAPDPTQALALYQEAVDKGSVDALVALGYMHLGTETGAADPKRALDYFTQAAKRDAPAGQTALGFLYLSGTGVAKDYGLARQWFERAIAVKHPPAYAGLAHIYATGLGVAANPKRAKDLYVEGATLGDVTAQLRLADLELRSPTTEERTETALRWLRAAAEQGHPDGQNGYAWVLATSRFERLRDGATAVEEAQKATASERSAQKLDTLAAAFAETGDFEKAQSTQRDAIAALTSDEEHLRAELNSHLDAYTKGNAWRE